MGNKTKIDWCDATFNPVTGCLHGCEYCYARKIAERFGGGWRHQSEPADKSWRHWRQSNDDLSRDLLGDWAYHANRQNHVLNEQCYSYPCCPIPEYTKENDPCRKKAPYPYYFDPTFHRYKLGEPQRWKKPRTIFVCSMADLFGDWVPDEWIKAVFDACEKAPWHRYIFLTKNPSRLMLMAAAKDVEEGIKYRPKDMEKIKGHTPLPKHDNWWFGSTLDNKDARRFQGWGYNSFVSIEPLTEFMDVGIGYFGSDKWVIIGAETGNRKDKVIPKREWVDNIVEAASITQMKVFMKGSLRDLMGDDFRQEFPWEAAK